MTPTENEIREALRESLQEGVRDEAISRLYLPIARFALQRWASSPSRPFFLGISGPQGGGKSTLAATLARAFVALGHSSVSLSIDDFYLTYREQCALAEKHARLRTLEYRGFPGTHDVGLGEQTLHDLSLGKDTKLPRYDKAAHGGRGDRAAMSTWSTSVGRQDFVLLEGWMLGFSPVPQERATEADLAVPNRYLTEYVRWEKFVHSMIVLEAADEGSIVEWRIEAERRRRQAGQAGLSDEQARDYIERFLPAYRLYVGPLVRKTLAAGGLHFVLERDRLPR